MADLNTDSSFSEPFLDYSNPFDSTADLLPGPLVFKPKTVIEVGPPSAIKVETPIWPSLIISTACPPGRFSSTGTIYICDENMKEVGDEGWLVRPRDNRLRQTVYPKPGARPSEDMIKNKTEGRNTAIEYAVFPDLSFVKTGRYHIRIRMKHVIPNSKST